MPIVGTAGHVDHGKSTLVQALTGTDPDRWDEEKRRGLTIDLGFASGTIADHEVGFVDVPGHERFIRNMLAGVVGVDCALLVVAADSGWMPQTEEHVRILDLIAAPRGIIALTRTDLVDADTIELAALEIADEVVGTSLVDWPVVPVSAVTGYGLDELRSTIASALDDVSPNTDAPFRMWIDRAFSIRGAGVVVTGTVQQGSLDVDSEVELMPARQRARVRGLQRHDQPISTVYAGSRAAINLGGVELTDASRGMLLADRGTTIDTTRLIVTWRASRGFEKLPRRGAFHVHSGTADAPATIRRLDETLLLVSTDTPIAAACGDRIIIREAGRQAVVGGGEVIDPNPLRRIGGSALAAMRAEDGNVADRILRYRGPIDANELARITGGINPTSGRRIGGLWTTHELVDRLALNARSLVAPYHEQYPKRPGIPIAELASRLGFDREIVATAVAGSSDLTVEEGFVSATGFAVTLNASDEATWDSARRQLEESYAVPRASALGLDDELLRALIRNDSLVQIEPDLVYTKDQIVAMTADLKGLPDGFTVSQFSDHFGTSRRHSVPLLEWFDALGVTHRTGNTRTLR